jgi:pentatricopeptide repeat protein
VECGDVEKALAVFGSMLASEVAPNAHSHHQLVDAGVVAGGWHSMKYWFPRPGEGLFDQQQS